MEETACTLVTLDRQRTIQFELNSQNERCGGLRARDGYFEKTGFSAATCCYVIRRSVF